MYETGIDSTTAPSLQYLLEDQRRMAGAKNYFAWQGRLVRPEVGRRVIEVGCGTGNFTGLLLDRQAVVAIDSEAACIDRLRRRYKDATNLETLVCDAGSPDFLDLARFQPDSCVCLNVLEHVKDDRGAVVAMANVLAPGGSVVLLLPAFPALRGPVDRNLGHFRRYRARDARALANAAGLRIRKLHYMNSLGWLGWWANAHLFRFQANPVWEIRTFDALVAPWLSRLEAVVAPPFGQSLFVVLEKPCA